MIESILQATTWFPTIEHTKAQRLFLAGANCRKVQRLWAHFCAPSLRKFGDAFSAPALLGCCACVTLHRNHAP